MQDRFDLSIAYDTREMGREVEIRCAPHTLHLFIAFLAAKILDICENHPPCPGGTVLSGPIKVLTQYTQVGESGCWNSLRFDAHLFLAFAREAAAKRSTREWASWPQRDDTIPLVTKALSAYQSLCDKTDAGQYDIEGYRPWVQYNEMLLNSPSLV